jgi:F0F1-type ATP synthase delta subunit
MNAYLKRYVEAVSGLLKEGADLKTTLRNLRSVMEKKGHGKIYPSVLTALLRTYPAAEKRSHPTLVVAKAGDEKNYKKMIDQTDTETAIDPTIVGGYVYTKDFVRQDHSHKSKLLTWYKKATTQE